MVVVGEGIGNKYLFGFYRIRINIEHYCTWSKGILATAITIVKLSLHKKKKKITTNKQKKKVKTKKNSFLVIAAKITAGERESIISVPLEAGEELGHGDPLMLLLCQTNYMSTFFPGNFCGK